jgi:hypothetical protein
MPLWDERRLLRPSPASWSASSDRSAYAVRLRCAVRLRRHVDQDQREKRRIDDGQSSADDVLDSAHVVVQHPDPESQGRRRAQAEQGDDVVTLLRCHHPEGEADQQEDLAPAERAKREGQGDAGGSEEGRVLHGLSSVLVIRTQGGEHVEEQERHGQADRERFKVDDVHHRTSKISAGRWPARFMKPSVVGRLPDYKL